jgi:hypothetical protein
MKQHKKFVNGLIGIAMAASLMVPAISMGNPDGQSPKGKKGKWMSGDFHQHTLYTDGSTSFDFVTDRNLEFGLDWWANSEHGGERNRDGNGAFWDAYLPPAQIQGVIKSSGSHRLMYRWQSLRDFVYPDILRTRALYPEKRIVSGVEWNVPGHEHCSVGVVSDALGPLAISAFEYQFDKSDTDASRTGEWTPFGTLVKANKTHTDSVAACKWMQDQLVSGWIDNAWIVFAHIERAGTGATGGYDINHFRDLNNAGPDVCFGFEGAPGHQVNNDRGFGNPVICDENNICTSKDFGGSYGGVGYYTAEVGGLWDALLGEGRRWFNFASSDYHTHWTAGGDDFYPGEYQKTWTHVLDENKDGLHSLSEIANGLRSGNSFHVMGDLIDSLEFTAEGRFKQVSMGGELNIEDRPWSREPVFLTIKFKSPETNNCKIDGTFVTSCPKPVVDHIDLIAGDITGVISPTLPDGTPNPDYSKATNESARVIATFTAEDWHTDREGNNVIRYRIPDLDRSMYFRLRGTNLAANTPFETDAEGNPLADALVTKNLGIDAAQEAWNDLWFYSNPIFVYLR